MPATHPTGQPDPGSAWFASAAGRVLIDSEAALIRRALADRPAPPWLWLAPQPQQVDDCGRGLCLAADGHGWRGALRCRLPLPFASESLATVVLQHVHGSGEQIDALLDECARMLIGGGRLHLLALNPLSPYRFRWRGAGLRASEPLTWRRRLRRAGLEPEPVSQGIGPGWKPAASPEPRSGPGLRAAYAVRAEKRVVPLTPAPRRARLRLQPGLRAG